MSSTPLISCAALPFLWAYEVSCRARTGSVLHKVTLDERLVIRPVFRIRETGGSPASLTIPARATSADTGCQCADITPACFTNQLGHRRDVDPTTQMTAYRYVFSDWWQEIGDQAALYGLGRSNLSVDVV